VTSASLQERLAELFLRHDPISIYFPEHGNEEEYAPEAKAVAAQLHSCKTEDQCLELVHASFVDFFGAPIAGGREQYADVAAEVWALRQTQSIPLRTPMLDEVVKSDRRFTIWKYTVSHSSLLLRSTKSDGVPTRIDVLFKGVREFHLPTNFTGVSIVEASEMEVQQLGILRRSPSVDKSDKVFKVQGRDFVGYVTAMAAFCHEDEREYYEPSFFHPVEVLGP
jgi:hypothetical protein